MRFPATAPFHQFDWCGRGVTTVSCKNHGLFAVEDKVRAEDFESENPLLLKRTRNSDFPRVFAVFIHSWNGSSQSARPAAQASFCSSRVFFWLISLAFSAVKVSRSINSLRNESKTFFWPSS